MKLFLSVAIALCCVVSADARSEATAEESIIAQENAWAAALVTGDLVAVSSILHRDFRLVRTYSEAQPISKQSYLGMKGMSASAVDVTSVTITEEAGPIVVARVTWSLDWQQDGVGKLPPHFDMIDSWIKGKDGVWRVFARVSQIADASYRERIGE